MRENKLKNATKKTSSKNSLQKDVSLRKSLSEVSFRLEDINAFEEDDFIVTKERLPSKESLTKGFLTSTAGKASEQLAVSREKIEKELEEINLDVKKLAEKGKNVSEEEMVQIHQEFVKRRKVGTINEKQLELTVALESKVKSIRKAGQQVQRILKSNTLKNNSQEGENITLEEHKVNTTPKITAKPIYKNKYLFYGVITSGVLFLAMLIALIVVFVI